MAEPCTAATTGSGAGKDAQGVAVERGDVLLLVVGKVETGTEVLALRSQDDGPAAVPAASSS